VEVIHETFSKVVPVKRKITNKKHTGAHNACKHKIVFISKDIEKRDY